MRQVVLSSKNYLGRGVCLKSTLELLGVFFFWGNDGFNGIAEQDENEYREVYCW